METVAETPRCVDVDAAELEHRARLEDKDIVDRQLNKYVDEGILDDDHREWVAFNFDLLRYWQVCICKLSYLQTIR